MTLKLFAVALVIASIVAIETVLNFVDRRKRVRSK